MSFLIFLVVFCLGLMVLPKELRTSMKLVNDAKV